MDPVHRASLVSVLSPSTFCQQGLFALRPTRWRPCAHWMLFCSACGRLPASVFNMKTQWSITTSNDESYFVELRQQDLRAAFCPYSRSTRPLQIRFDRCVCLYPSIGASIAESIHQSGLIETHSSIPHPLSVSPLVGASGRGPLLICSQNKQPGKHHETFRGGRASFPLIRTGNSEMHKNSCSQSSPLPRASG